MEIELMPLIISMLKQVLVLNTNYIYHIIINVLILLLLIIFLILLINVVNNYNDSNEY